MPTEEQIKQIEQEAAAIADALTMIGEPFTWKQNQYTEINHLQEYQRLRHAGVPFEKAVIKLRFNNGRIKVFGVYPKAPNRAEPLITHDDEPVITCARDRGAVAIAKDITRRFLPDYWKTYEKRHKLLKERIGQIAWTQQTVHMLSQFNIHSHQPHSQNTNHRAEVTLFHPHIRRLEVNGYNESIYFGEFRVSRDTATKILKLIEQDQENQS